MGPSSNLRTVTKKYFHSNYIDELKIKVKMYSLSNVNFLLLAFTAVVAWILLLTHSAILTGVWVTLVDVYFTLVTSESCNVKWKRIRF